MKDEEIGDNEVNTVVKNKKRVKKTQNFKSHIAVREETLKDFRELKDEPGSDAFLKKLLHLYNKMQLFKKSKEEKNAV